MRQEVMDIFSLQSGAAHSFDAIRISIASPEKIMSWSYGEIKKPETINYRTFKPERDGLFCSRVFGPIKDYECLCGKYKRIKYKGVICEKCGVEVTLSRVRRERMGHIELASPVAHVWFLKSLPTRIGTLLDISLKDLERILYFESYVVTEPGLTPLKLHELLSADSYVRAKEEYGECSFTAMIGAEAIRNMLSSLDLPALSVRLRSEIAEGVSDAKHKKLSKRLALVENFIHSGNLPEWMVMTVIPVLPPDLRPLVPLDGGRFATSDLNDLYRRVINRNNRLRRLFELRAPDIIIRNEQRMLQEAVDALFDNGRRGRVITGANRRPLKSLSDMLKGKQGRFRQNLLGKRVDYSGRSVIVVGPELQLHQCGLPKKMALELFKPFVYERLEARGLSATIKQSKKIVDKERPEVWEVLEEVIHEHPVLLNRAPTLHRLGIQAFEPVLIEGKAIQLHPLVCSAFNADFDGDQMAVHVPLSYESQLEARILMMATNNILHPANGLPVIVPSQDIVLGLYYLSLMAPNDVGDGMVFGSAAEIIYALDTGVVNMHTRVRARVSAMNQHGEVESNIYETTPGRMLIWDLIPRKEEIQFNICNVLMTKKNISALIDVVYRTFGQKETVTFCDRIMNLGFYRAFKAGISFGKDDMVVPVAKARMISETRAAAKEFEQQYQEGLITKGEKYNKVIDTWARCTDRVADEMMKQISSTGLEGDTSSQQQINSIYMMSHSGARGSPTQMRQLSAMRGLMTKPSGEIIESPILSNFKEGLTVLEYFNSTHGARKGLADTALKTANSGYLTRRLVDVAQDCIITTEDCGTSLGIRVQAAIDSGQIITSLSDRVLGRVTAEDIVDPRSNEVLVHKGQMIEEADAKKIEVANIQAVLIRSVLMCEAISGVCTRCYGRDLARGALVNHGEAVGVIAAQSIGEPGTQLTMRTFHVGGTAQVMDTSFVDSNFDGVIQIRNRNVAQDSENRLIVMAKNLAVAVIGPDGSERSVNRLIYGARLLVDDGSEVKRGQRLAEWDPYTRPIIAEADGIVKYEDLIDSQTMQETTDVSTGITKRVVIDWRVSARTADLKPALAITDSHGAVSCYPRGGEVRYFLPVDAILSASPGAKVKAGDIIARISVESARTRDITGGLPRIAELFEARCPKEHAIIAEISGTVKFEKDHRSKRRLLVEAFDGSESKAYLIPKGRHVHFQSGDIVEKGDFILDGHPSPHDILAVKGVEALADYLINEIQEVYRLQGVILNDKHIEVIVRQMLQKVEITDVGDSDLRIGEQIDKVDLYCINNSLASSGKQTVTASPVLLGITKSSLRTSSFISSASFQETTRVLTEAAVSGKIDLLEGLKENVIVGRLIPVGTGAVLNKMRRVAGKRDELVSKKEPSIAAIT